MSKYTSDQRNTNKYAKARLGRHSRHIRILK